MTAVGKEGGAVSLQSHIRSILICFHVTVNIQFAGAKTTPQKYAVFWVFFLQWLCCRIWVCRVWVTSWLYLHMPGDMQVLLPVGCGKFMGRVRHRSMRRQWRREIIRPYRKFLEPQMCVRAGACGCRTKCSQALVYMHNR